MKTFEELLNIHVNSLGKDATAAEKKRARDSYISGFITMHTITMMLTTLDVQTAHMILQSYNDETQEILKDIERRKAELN